MTRYERKIYSFGVVIAAILIIAIVAVLTEGCGTGTAVYAAPMVNVEDFTEVETEAPKKAEIRDHNANQRTQRVETLEETDEPETGEKEVQETIWIDAGETGDGDHQSAQPGSNENIYGCGVEDRRSSDGGDPENDRDPEGPRLYMISGELIDPEIQRKLYRALEAEGIDYWYTGALAQMFQESHCHQYAENPNGLDKGIYQYRITYWNWNDGDIFSIDAQLQRYASEMSARFNAGLSVDEAISRHKTSDYCTTVDWTYVGHVKQWLGQMEVVK